MKKHTIIVAGGSGQRMNSEVPKQFLLLNNLPILMHTINRFYDFDKENNIILVLPESQINYWKDLCTKHNFIINHTIAIGGETRFHSVKSGLAIIPSNEESLVAVHDGVRPFVKISVIQNCFETASKTGNAIPVIACNDSVRVTSLTGSKIINRDAIKLVQTPQVFKNTILQRAYQTAFSVEFTDDASVVEKLGEQIHLVDGNEENIKITRPLDLKIAEKVLLADF